MFLIIYHAYLKWFCDGEICLSMHCILIFQSFPGVVIFLAPLHRMILQLRAASTFLYLKSSMPVGLGRPLKQGGC